MLKKNFCIFALFLAVLLTACGKGGAPGKQEDPKHEGKYEDLTVDKIPTPEEFRALPVDEQNALQLAMEQIPASDYVEHFEQAVKDYCASDAVPEGVDTVELAGVTVERDTLSLVPGQNKKSLSDLVIHIELTMEAVDPLEYSSVASDNHAALIHYLQDHVFAFYMSQDFSLKTTSEHGYLEELPGHKSTEHEIVFREQPASEYALQTLAFDFAEKHDDFTLEKFGALPETKELYMEFYVEDDYLLSGEGSNQERLDANTAKLADVCEEIAEAVMTGDEAKLYMEENGLTSYTIAFKNGNWEDGYQLFHKEHAK